MGSLDQAWHAAFVERLDESELDPDVVEWLGRESRGALLFPRQRLFQLFENLTGSLATASVASAQSDAFWTTFHGPLLSLLEESLRPEQPEDADSPFLADFAALIIAVFRRVYIRGLARAKRDQLQDGQMSLAHLAGPVPASGPGGQPEPDEEDEEPLDFRALQAIPAGSRRALREDLAQRDQFRLYAEQPDDL